MSAPSAIRPLPRAVRTVTSPRTVSSATTDSARAITRMHGISSDKPAIDRKLSQAISLDGEIHNLARSIAQAAVEVLAGTRPVLQLSRSLDPRCFNALQHRAILTRTHTANSQAGRSRLHRSPVVRSVRVCAITENVYETSLVVSEELRSRAVAIRLERHKGTWKVTALEIG